MCFSCGLLAKKTVATFDSVLQIPNMRSPLKAVYDAITKFSGPCTLLPVPHAPNTAPQFPQIHILTSRRHSEFTLIVNEIAKTRYEYVHDLMSNV